MNFENCNDDCFRNALEKIKHDEKNRIKCCLGATGPTGPTERLFKSSNRIIIDSS